MLDRTEAIADIFVLIPNLLTNSVSIVSSCSHLSMMSLHYLRKTIDPSQVVQTNQRPSRRDERAYRALLLAHYTQRSTCLASSICDDCVNLFNIYFIITPRSPKKQLHLPLPQYVVGITPLSPHAHAASLTAVGGCRRLGS
jgi:hypothetical protein